MQKLSHGQLAALVKSVQQGNSDAFATLYAATVERQLYFATTFLKDAALAQDAIQEVYLSVYKSIDKLDNPKLFVAYLNRITYNICVNFQRGIARRHVELDDTALERHRDTTVMNNPDERYALLEQSSELQQALSTLPDQLRATFLFRYYDELRIHEIAAIMDISQSTVKRNIKAAIAQLKQHKNLDPQHQHAAAEDSDYGN